MKPRHAATLALIAWYLMMPQRSVNAPINMSLPLAEWRVYETFNSGANCQKKFIRLYALAEQNKQYDLQSLYLNSQCVPSDDARLKPSPKPK